jgi:ribosomal-protein-alanine N-acetyltransferase
MTPEALAATHAAAFTRPRPWAAAEFRSVLAGAGTFLLTEGGGFLVGRALAGEAELLTLAVPAAARRGGIGRRLLAGFEAEAGTRGAAEGFLEVASDNRAALALYHHAGWAEAGRRRGYYAPGIDALILRKALSAG